MRRRLVKCYASYIREEHAPVGKLGKLVFSLALISAFTFTSLISYAQQDEEFVGVGIRLEIRYEQLVVVEPIKDSPACRAGVKARDRILQIDGQSTIGMSLEEASSLLRGAKGVPVRITLQHDDGTKETVTIIRDVIRSNEVCVEASEEETEEPATILLADFNGFEVNEEWIESEVSSWWECMRVMNAPCVEVPKWRTIYKYGPFFDEDEAEIKDGYPFDSVDPEGHRGVLRVEYQLLKPDAYAGYFWKLKDFDPSDYPFLTLYVRGDPTAGYPEKLKVELKVPNVGWYYRYIEITDAWQEFTLPLTTFEKAEWAEGKPLEFVITVEESATTEDEGAFYIDEISFTNPLLLLQRVASEVAPEEASAMQEQLALVDKYMTWLEDQVHSLKKELDKKNGEFKQLSYHRNLYLPTTSASLLLLLAIATWGLWARFRKRKG